MNRNNGFKCTELFSVTYGGNSGLVLLVHKVSVLYLFKIVPTYDFMHLALGEGHF